MSTTYRVVVAFVTALLLAGVNSRAVRAADAPKNPRYAGLPNLTEEQKAKIAAIEKQADAQVTALLTDEQKSALAAADGGAAAPAGGGLYAAEAGAKTGGPIKSRDYWQSKFNAEQLEQAIKDHQPEGAIGMNLIFSIRLLDDLLKQYPNHAELKAWRARATQVQKMIGDNFNRRDSFKPGCLWNEDSYMQSYVGYNTAKTAMAEKDYELGFMMAGLAKQKIEFLTGSGDRMANYPAEAKAFINKIKPEVNEMWETTGKATHHL